MIPVGSINERVKRRSVDKYFQIGIVWSVWSVWSVGNVGNVGNEALSDFRPQSFSFRSQVSALIPQSLSSVAKLPTANRAFFFLTVSSRFRSEWTR